MASDRRNQVMVGDLPDDFLRVSSDPTAQQIAQDERVAQILQAQQQAGVSFVTGNIAGRLSITIVTAKLTKNYGITKMDPYCRIRVGHAVFETPTSYNGAKIPRWNKCVQCYLPVGVDSMYLEIFDERSFTVDDRIAWCHITVPQSVLNGETLDDWYPLSGRQGEEKEGMINLVLTFTPIQNLPMGSFVCPQPAMVIPQVVSPGMFYTPMQPVVGGAPVYQQPQLPPTSAQSPLYTEEDIQLVKDMFPAIETDVIQSVFVAQRGNKNAVINSLLSMSSEQ